jgi:hypothetical protein
MEQWNLKSSRLKPLFGTNEGIEYLGIILDQHGNRHEKVDFERFRRQRRREINE